MTKKEKTGLDKLLDFAEKAVGTLEGVLPTSEEATHDESEQEAEELLGTSEWICLREISGWSWHASDQLGRALCGRPYTAGLVGSQRIEDMGRGFIMVCVRCLVLKSRQTRAKASLQLGSGDE